MVEGNVHLANERLGHVAHQRRDGSMRLAAMEVEIKNLEKLRG